jgi:hypothetical protein
MRPIRRLLPVPLALAVAGGFALLLAPRTAAAQTTVTPEVGLGQYYRTGKWLPLRLQLTNQGGAVQAEVRARLPVVREGTQEYRLPPRRLQSNANELHTLYLKPSTAYVGQGLTVDLYRDGQLINTARPSSRMLSDNQWLVYGVGRPESTGALQLLTVGQSPPRQTNPQGRGQGMPISVAVDEPARLPDRSQGLDAADMVVLAGVSERDFTAAQLRTLRDYVVSGGTLVVTGGLNYNRFTTPFFQAILPVRVTGGGTLPSRSGSYPVCRFTLKPGSRVERTEQGVPVIAWASKGAGRVVFIAFDPALPPYLESTSTRSVWTGFLRAPSRGGVLQAAVGEGAFNPYPGTYHSGAAQLAQAPYSIPQLDIPAFYVVALFLLAYVVILVPVNYFVLKARDKKEWAWVTTPAIVGVFSAGAYLIGYGFKGGNTVAVKVGVIEARVGQDAAPFVMYGGVFSPRKAGYDVRLASAAGNAPDPFAGGLFSEPEQSQATTGLRVSQDEVQQIDDFGVDMWAMRVLKLEGVADLGGGFTTSATGSGGTVRNDTPFTLEDACIVTAADEVKELGAFAAGAQAPIPVSAPGRGAGTVLPPALTGRYPGNTPEMRMKRAILEPLVSQTVLTNQDSGAAHYPMLVGWIRDPVARIEIDGRPSREQAQTLMVVHLKN